MKNPKIVQQFMPTIAAIFLQGYFLANFLLNNLFGRTLKFLKSFTLQEVNFESEISGGFKDPVKIESPPIIYWDFFNIKSSINPAMPEYYLFFKIDEDNPLRVSPSLFEEVKEKHLINDGIKHKISLKKFCGYELINSIEIV